MALADQLSIKLVVAFSEAGQPLTLTSDPNDADEDETPDIFCAIATTTCDQFLTVRTQSDQAQSNGRTGSGSSASFLNRNNSRQRQFSEAANDLNENENGNGETGERNVRQRLDSASSSRRGRLSLSTQPSRVPNSVPTTTSRTSGGPSKSQHQQNNNGAEALFIATDTQHQLDNEYEYRDQIEDNNAPRHSQAEVEAIASLGDMEDVLDGMDDLQHEEEVEEMRASQQAASQAPPPPSNRRPLAERLLEDMGGLNPEESMAEAAVEAPDVGEIAPPGDEEGDHEGDITRQADFEVHVNQGNGPPIEEANEVTAEPPEGDIAAAPVDDQDKTAEMLEVEEEEVTFPATQAANDDAHRVSQLQIIPYSTSADHQFQTFFAD